MDENKTPAPVQHVTVPFNALCYGARFRYVDQTKVWVKIGHDLIAEWDASKVADKWIGQTVCSFSENGDVSEAVQLVLDPSPQPNVEPVAWRWVWKTTGSELEQRFADPDLYEWTYRHTPPSGEAAEKMIVEPLYAHPAPVAREVGE